MHLSKNCFLLILIVLCAIKGFSQMNCKLPISIYSPGTPILFFDNNSRFQNEINSMGYPFVMVNIEDIKSNLFTIAFNNIGKTPTNYVFESYQKIIFNETSKYFDPNKTLIPTKF